MSKDVQHSGRSFTRDFNFSGPCKAKKNECTEWQKFDRKHLSELPMYFNASYCLDRKAWCLHDKWQEGAGIILRTRRVVPVVKWVHHSEGKPPNEVPWPIVKLTTSPPQLAEVWVAWWKRGNKCTELLIDQYVRNVRNTGHNNKNLS